MVLSVRVRRIQAILGEWKIQDEPMIGGAAADLILKPNLAMERRLIVLKQRKRSRLHGGSYLVQLRKDGIEFAFLVKPQADPRSLLVLEASREFLDQRRKNHLHYLRDAQHAGTLERLNVYLYAVVDVRVQPLGRSFSLFHGVRIR